MNSPLRVFHLISSSDFFGAERVVAELSASLARQGNVVFVGVITTNYRLLKIFRNAIEDMSVVIVQFDGQGTINRKTIMSVGGFFINNRIDLVHCHGYKSNLYALLAKKTTRSKIILFATNHNWIGSTVREKIYQKIDSITLRFFDKIVAVSENVKVQMESKGLANKDISIIANGINVHDSDFGTTVPEARALLGLSPEDFVVGNMARFTPEKDQRALVMAFTRLRDLPRLKLVLVGDGPDLVTVKELVVSLELEGRVLFTGNRTDARKLFGAFDVFALVSTNEGLPMVLLEAMAAGVAVIATRVGAVSEVAVHGDNALLLDPSQQEELIAAIKTLYGNEKLKRRFAVMGSERVRRFFSGDDMASKYNQEYKVCCAGNSSGRQHSVLHNTGRWGR